MEQTITEATLRGSEYTLLLIDMPLQRETVRCALTRNQVQRVLDHGWILFKEATGQGRPSSPSACYTYRIALNRAAVHWESIENGKPIMDHWSAALFDAHLELI